jgi:predicted nucleic-acid-binding protein
MLAFDTNHLLRHVLQDDPTQCRDVGRLLQAEANAGQQILIVDFVLLESSWVLTKVYRFGKAEWCDVFEALLADSAFAYEDVEKLRHALDLYRNGRADFSDCLILAQARTLGADLKTFDRKLKELI